jgi:hypothetical protein
MFIVCSLPEIEIWATVFDIVDRMCAAVDAFLAKTARGCARSPEDGPRTSQMSIASFLYMRSRGRGANLLWKRQYWVSYAKYNSLEFRVLMLDYPDGHATTGARRRQEVSEDGLHVVHEPLGRFQQLVHEVHLSTLSLLRTAAIRTFMRPRRRCRSATRDCAPSWRQHRMPSSNPPVGARRGRRCRRLRAAFPANSCA